jgi:hypothetical protein
MTKRLALLAPALLCLVYPVVAQAQGLVLTWEDDATIQLFQNPDGSFPAPPPPAEPMSGGMAAKFLYNDTLWGGPLSVWLATDFRLQSRSFTVTWNPKACGGRLLTLDPSSGVGIEVSIAMHASVNNNLWTNTTALNPNTNPIPAWCTGQDTAIVTVQGVPYTGAIQFDGSFTGATIEAPGEVPNAGGVVTFGAGGAAIITGTLRAELSDGTAAVVKLRQGIPAGPSPN